MGSTTRGRRDVRNTIFVPSPEPGTIPKEPTVVANVGSSIGVEPERLAAAAVDDLIAPSSAKTSGIMGDERAMSDTTSVRSAQSLGAVAHHPDMLAPGLNASIVETVSTWFSDGEVTKSFVIGEVGLAYNPSPDSRDKEVVRLENFQMLDKIAPNPSFVTSTALEKGKEKASLSEERAGEYRIALSAIKRSTPVVAFKYQVHLDSSALSTSSPLLITSAWQIQDGQASVIVMYTLNPAFGYATAADASSTTPRPITLKNAVVTITLDPAPDAGKATSAMMAPQNGASFRRKQGLVVWRFPELPVSDTKQKLLARFSITGAKARPGSVEAKWELPNTPGSRLSVSVLRVGAEGKQKPAADPFADDGTTATTAGLVSEWSEVPTARCLISGRYNAA
jgi:F-BAR domain only protein